jgi:glycosyltransferase involved in cell wall biosynthesis
MPDSPRISVILPFKNSREFFEEAVQSIENQTLEDWELILVDNGSKDGSKSMAKNFEKRDSRIKLIQFPFKGVAGAFNYGFKESRAPIIARMDSDDIAQPERLEKQLNSLMSHNMAGLHYSRVKSIGRSSIGWLRYLVWQNSHLQQIQIYQDRFVEMPVCNATLMATRESFLKIGLYKEGTYPEDYDFFLRACSLKVPIQKISQPLLLWRDHPNRLTRTHKGYSREKFFEVKAKYLFRYSSLKNRKHPVISIWGTGKNARKYLELLEKEGFRFARFFDLRSGEFKRRKIEPYEKIQKGEFLVSLVGNRGAGWKIENYLSQRGMEKGVDFILAG